jgi:hypothetical protein
MRMKICIEALITLLFRCLLKQLEIPGRSLRLTLCVPLFLTGCATTKDSGPPQALQAKDYYSLIEGNAWTYRVRPASEGHDVDTVLITGKDHEGFYIDDHGGRLQARSNGIFDGDRFLLEDPLEIDHSWIAVPTPSAVERYKIIDVNRSVSVPAGNFLNCVVVRGEQPGISADGRDILVIMKWTYAPGVGLVELVQEIKIGDGPAKQTLERRLIQYNFSSGARERASS